MQRSLLVLLLLAAFAAGTVGLFVLLSHGGNAGDPADALPSGVNAALVIPSLPQLLKNLGRTRMAPAPGESGWDLLAELLSEGLGSRGISYEPDPGALSKVLRGGVAIGWLASGKRGNPPALVLALELPSRRDDLLDLVEESVLPDLRAAGAVTARHVHRGHEYLAIRFPGASTVIAVAGYGRLAIITFTRDAMRQSLSTLMRHDPGLLADASYRRVGRDLQGESDVVAFFSESYFRDLEASAAGTVPEEGPWRRALASAGGIRGAGISLTVEREGLFHERLRVLVPGISDTLPGKVFGSRPTEIESASLLPPGYPFYAGASFSHSESMWELLPDWLAPLTRQEPAHLRDRLLGLEQFMGLDVRRDLLGVMGNEIAVAVDPASDNPFVLALRPTDLTAARRLLARVDGLAKAAEAYHLHAVKGGEITTYEHARFAPLRPSYVFAGQSLLLAGSPDPLEQALRASQSADRDRRAPFDFGKPAHLALVADTEQTIGWIRRLSSSGSDADPERKTAWLRRLRDLLPGSSGPLPPLSASFDLTRDGLTGEWTGPLSPVLLTSLLLASPGEPPAADAPLPVEEQPEPSPDPQDR